MKRTRILTVVALVLICMAAAGDVLAATIQPTVNVSATVQGTCRIITSPGAMSFDIDPGLAGPINATVSQQPLIRCTNGKAAAVTADSTNFAGGGGASPQTGTLIGPGSINYSFTFNNNVAGTGHGAGQDVPLNVAGSVQAADYADAAVSAALGDYTDTITFTVTY